MKGHSAHVDALYATLPREQRFGAAAADGFRCVEMWAAPALEDDGIVIAELNRHGLALASVNTDAGPADDDFGLLGDPSSVGWWREEFVRTLDFARRAGAEAINVLVGGRRPTATRTAQLQCVDANLEWALSLLSVDDPVLLIEPLNGVDRRSPLVRDVKDAMAIITELGSPAQLRLLFDAYHLFQEEADLGAALRAAAECIGHVQIADYPGRGAPGSGVIPLEAFLADLERTGYSGWVGLEYFA